MKRALSRKNLWEGTSQSVRTLLGRIFSLVPPAYLMGRRFRENLRFVEEAQWWPAEQAREYQLKQLRSICTLAYERSSYYRACFEEADFHPSELRRVEDICNLPTIDKETVREHLGQMMVVPCGARHVDYVSTGGSSGTTLRFYIGKDRSAIEYAYLVSGWQRANYRLGMPVAVLRGRVLSGGRRYEYDPLLRHHYYSSFHMTEENMRWYTEHIRRLGPSFLHAYPSAAATLAAFCKRSRIAMPSDILGVLAESEMVYPEQREMIEQVCNTRLFSSYGHCEKLVAAAECEHSSDYHVWPTYGYFELLDEKGAPVTSVGQAGEIVGTGFINRVTPFIRYRTGDWATYAGHRCEACGREHTIIRDIRGHRTQEVLIAADGSEISWTALNMHDDTFAHVRQFQFRQDTAGRAVLRVVPTPGFGEEDVKRIRRNLGRKLDGRLELTIELADAIPLSPRGKAIYVDQRVPRPVSCAQADSV